MSWNFLRQNKIKAKKVHICLCCGENILLDEYYIKRIGTDDNRIIEMKMHIECEKASSGWDDEDWETFDTYSMERPYRKLKENGDDQKM